MTVFICIYLEVFVFGKYRLIDCVFMSFVEAKENNMG